MHLRAPTHGAVALLAEADAVHPSPQPPVAPWVAALRDALSELSASIYRQGMLVHFAGATTKGQGFESIRKRVLHACTDALQPVVLKPDANVSTGVQAALTKGCETFPSWSASMSAKAS